MPTISVVIPVYNAEKYLNYCINSILDQSFTDFEVLLVDDGSKDNSGKICDDFAKKDGRIKVIHKENGGQASARNTGLQSATGKYLMFCDNDDYIHREYFASMLKCITSMPQKLVFCQVKRVFEYNEDLINTSIGIVTGNTVDYYSLYKTGLSGNIFTCIYNREIVSINNIYFDGSMPTGEDALFNANYLKYCDGYYLIDQELYFYMQHPGSIMKTYFPKYLEYLLTTFYCRIPFVEEKYLGEYCDDWLGTFIRLFDNVFDKRNIGMSLFAKIRYNSNMLRTEEFIYCIEHSTGKNESPRVYNLLKNKHYLCFYIYQKLASIRKK